MAAFNWKSFSLLLASSLFSVPTNAGQGDSICSQAPYAKFLTLSNYGPAETYCSSKYPLPVVTVTAQPKIKRGGYNGYPKCRPVGTWDPYCGDACTSFSTLTTQDPSFISTLCSCIETPRTTTVYATTTATTTRTSGQTTSTATATSSTTAQSTTSTTTSAVTTTLLPTTILPTTTLSTITLPTTTLSTITLPTTTLSTITLPTTTLPTTITTPSTTTSATTTASILPCASIAVGDGEFIIQGTATNAGTIYFQDAGTGLQNYRGTTVQSLAIALLDLSGVLSYTKADSSTAPLIAGGNDNDPLYNAPIGYYAEPPGSKVQITIDPLTCGVSVYANFGDVTVPNPTIVSKNVLLLRPNNNNGLSLQAPLDQFPAGAEQVTNLKAIPL